MIDTLQIYQDLAETLGDAAARKLAAALGAIYRDLQQTVTKEDFGQLKQVVAELAEAQKRTEARVEELAEAQKRTEERLDSLTAKVEELAEAQKRTEARVEELAEAQKRTEERLDSLAAKVEELAEAQKRTEARVEELAEAQKRTEERLDSLTAKVEDLAAAQKRTEETMLAGFADIHRRFGVLGARWGDGAEEAFRQGLLEAVRGLGYTVEHYHGQDPDGFIDYSPRSFDLDVLVRDGEVVVAEIKSNANGPDVTEFHRCVLLFERQTGRRASKRILVAVTIQRAALERARQLGVIVATDWAALKDASGQSG